MRYEKKEKEEEVKSLKHKIGKCQANLWACEKRRYNVVGLIGKINLDNR